MFQKHIFKLLNTMVMYGHCWYDVHVFHQAVRHMYLHGYMHHPHLTAWVLGEKTIYHLQNFFNYSTSNYQQCFYQLENPSVYLHLDKTSYLQTKQGLKGWVFQAGILSFKGTALHTCASCIQHLSFCVQCKLQGKLLASSNSRSN